MVKERELKIGDICLNTLDDDFGRYNGKDHSGHYCFVRNRSQWDEKAGYSRFNESGNPKYSWKVKSLKNIEKAYFGKQKEKVVEMYYEWEGIKYVHPWIGQEVFVQLENKLSAPLHKRLFIADRRQNACMVVKEFLTEGFQNKFEREKFNKDNRRIFLNGNAYRPELAFNPILIEEDE